MAKQGQSSEVEPHISKVAEISNHFALQLYQFLQPGFKGENLFFSPMSISNALAMTYMGCRGITAEQMAQVLRFNLLDEKTLHLAFKELNTLLYDPNRPYVLKSANRLFGQKGYTFLPEFLDGTLSYYGARLEAVDFDNEAARELINNWVEEQTAQKISNLLLPGSLDDLVNLVLVNAIYFKGDWANKFDANLTQEEPFNLSATKSVPTLMMHQQSPEEYNFGSDRGLKCKVLELPYKGDHVSMVLLLPDEIQGLGKLESQLNTDRLNQIISNMHQMKVSVSVPRFKFSQRCYLKDTLSQMGIEDLFLGYGKANLSGVNGARDLHVSQVIHKAFIDVNEEGSEAAAATATVAEFDGIDLYMPPEFRADHAFLFIIRDKITGAILFLGRLMTPVINSCN